MIVNGFELAVEVGGKRIPEYGHKGLTYVCGHKGHKYTIKFRNNRAERVLVIPSVDGKSTVDGQPCSPNSNGYVVKGYSSLTISGWRTSLSSINSFEFTDKPGSYAGKSEGTANCGIIGVIIYSEKLPPTPPPPTTIIKEVHHHHDHYHPHYPPWRPYWVGPDIICGSTADSSGGAITSKCWGSSTSSGMLASNEQMKCAKTEPQYTSSANLSDDQVLFMGNMSAASAPDFNLGTGWGGAVEDRVSEVSFDKGVIMATMEIYYSDRDGLVKDGIQVDKAPELAVFPQAFGGFCKPPTY